MAQFWRTKEFKALQIEWSYKLKLAGFEDAEVEIKGEKTLKPKSTIPSSFCQASELERESRLEYFRFLGYLAHNTVFPNETEKIILIKHSEGALVKEIVEELKKQGLGVHRNTVTFIIRRWQNKWGIKTWSLQQMKTIKKS